MSVTAIILIQGWSAFSPSFDAVSFVSDYIEIPLFLVLYVVWRLIKRVKSHTLLQIDLDSELYEDGPDEELDNDKANARQQGEWGWAWKIYDAVL